MDVKAWMREQITAGAFVDADKRNAAELARAARAALHPPRGSASDCLRWAREVLAEPRPPKPPPPVPRCALCSKDLRGEKWRNITLRYDDDREVCIDCFEAHHGAEVRAAAERYYTFLVRWKWDLANKIAADPALYQRFMAEEEERRA
jgi:hypothetical protein